jgi:hypothetical protein
VRILRKTAEAKIGELERAKEENARLTAEHEQMQRSAEDARAKVQAAMSGNLSQLASQLDAARAAHAKAEEELRGARKERDDAVAATAQAEASVALLREDRASLVE